MTAGDDGATAAPVARWEHPKGRCLSVQCARCYPMTPVRHDCHPLDLPCGYGPGPCRTHEMKKQEPSEQGESRG